MTNMEMLFKMLNDQYTDAHFEALLQIVDRLHDAATANCLESVSPLSRHEILGWLDDIIFTAEETIREIQATQAIESPAKGWHN